LEKINKKIEILFQELFWIGLNVYKFILEIVIKREYLETRHR
jgi:hypothetical protein